MKNDVFNKYQEIWESRASIRTRPRKIIDFTKNGYFFPEDKQPLLFHQEILSLGQEIKEIILLQSLYKYLHDIINLEIKLFSSACHKIIHNELVIEYSEETKLNIHTILIDEYYHVYMAKDMIMQLNNQFPDLTKFTYKNPDSCEAVQFISNKLDEKYRGVFEIIAVCIFETTLVKELVEFFYTDSIHPSIKHYVNDHMNDEAKHYGFFYDLLGYTWKNIPEDYRKNIGQYFATFIKSYLNINSEKNFSLELLTSIFHDQEKSEKIITELYQGFDITPEIPIVKNVLNVLRKTGLLEDKYINESFKKIEWNL